MKAILFSLLVVFPLALFAQRDSSALKRPDLSKLNVTDLHWRRGEGGSFWFYYRPASYFFESKEFLNRTLDNGDVLIYLFDPGVYVLLPDFVNTEMNKDKEVEGITTRSSVFIRRGPGANFFILDHGQPVQSLERIGINAARQYVYRSRFSDKRYWIEESDFLSAPISRPVGILAE